MKIDSLENLLCGYLGVKGLKTCAKIGDVGVILSNSVSKSLVFYIHWDIFPLKFNPFVSSVHIGAASK